MNISDMSERQRDRYDRVVSAAVELGAEGGYDAVQMRDVSARSGVALGTIYRYFSSKDQLLVTAMASRTAKLRGRLGQSPPSGATPAARVNDILQRAYRSLAREPLLTSAFVRALSSSDVGVNSAGKAMGQHVRAMLEPVLDEFDAGTREDIIAIINHVWLSALIGWSTGRIPFSDVSVQLEVAARLLIAPRAVAPEKR